MKRLPLVASFLLFIALCASAAYWGMQLFKPPPRQVAAPPRVAQAEIRPDAASGLFGDRRGNVAVASNYQLKGVIFSGSPRDSVAILSADGKPPQAIRINAEVAPGVTVKEVHRGYVLLSEGGATKRVELPVDTKLQNDLSIAPVPVRPSSPAQGQAIPSRAQAAAAMPATPPPVTSPPTALPGQVPMPTAQVPGQVPMPSTAMPGQAAGQVPGQIPGQLQQSQVPQTFAGAPPTVVVSPPPSGQTGSIPGSSGTTIPQSDIPPSAIPPANPAATATMPGQQPMSGMPPTR